MPVPTTPWRRSISFACVTCDNVETRVYETQQPPRPDHIFSIIRCDKCTRLGKKLPPLKKA